MPRPRRVAPLPAPDAAPPRWSLLLRAVRESSGVTQDGWAARFGYSRATIQRWERGQAVPDQAAEETLIAICRERRLLRYFESGPLGGMTLTAELLHDQLAEARGDGRRLVPALPPHLARIFDRLRARARREAAAAAGDAAASRPAPAAEGIAEPSEPFVGRVQELQEIRRLLASTRLLTLTGAGGIGKTRLALRLARVLTRSYPGGVTFADLSALADPGLVPGAVAAALGVREEPNRSVGESIVRRVGDATGLLILDNCEHVLGASAALAELLLRSCRNLTLLATSRTPLGAAGELVWRVPPMAVPGSSFRVPCVTDSNQELGTTNQELEREDAVRLFTVRAAAAVPTFALTAANAAAVAAICRRLDGIPLAIELAAARVRILTPEQIAARLDDRFRLLAGGAAARPRHQTMLAALEWSHDLLGDTERRLFRRLAVVASGCRIEAVESICADSRAQGVGQRATDDPLPLPSEDVFDTLTYLVDKSLVVVEYRAGGARYRLTETIRAYALARLAASGEEQAVRQRHATHFLALAAAENGRLVGPEQAAALERLREDEDNLRAALAFSLESGQVGSAAELVTRLWRFWLLIGRAGEGRNWIARVLATGDGLTSLLRAKLLDAAGSLAHFQGDYVEAQRTHQESLAIWRDLQDIAGIAGAVGGLGAAQKERGELAAAEGSFHEALGRWRQLGNDARVAMTLNNLAAVAMDRGDLTQARRVLEESLLLRRRLGDQPGTATALYNLAETARGLGETERAAALLEEGLALARVAGPPQVVAMSMHGLGRLAVAGGDLVGADVRLREGLSLFQAIGSMPGIALCLEGLAEVALARAEHSRAAWLLGAAAALREGADAPPAALDQQAIERTVGGVRTAIGEAAFERAWSLGHSLTPEQVLAMDTAGHDGPHGSQR